MLRHTGVNMTQSARAGVRQALWARYFSGVSPVWQELPPFQQHVLRMTKAYVTKYEAFRYENSSRFNSDVLWFVMPCCMVQLCQCFSFCCLHNQSFKLYTRRHVPEHSIIHSHAIIIIIIIIFSGSAAQRGLWPPRSRSFLITHNDAPQSVGLLWTSD
jgi:hypothetical protein